MRWSYVHSSSGHESESLLDLRDRAGLDPGGVADLLAFGHPLGERTLLAGVLGRTGAWDLPPPDPHPADLPTAPHRRDRLWLLLREAVRAAAEGFSRPRVTLSGGLDSRAVAAAAAAEGLPVDCATFGDPDCEDIPAARRIAQGLDLDHVVVELPPDAALLHEDRTWRATGGLGGPAAAPGAHTDVPWAADCDVILSGMSGEAVWGDLGAPGPSPARRLKRLGVDVPLQTPADVAPEPPQWLPRASLGAWINLHTRQARGTSAGVRSRVLHTAFVPVPWTPRLLAFCLALPPEDRAGRALLRQALEHHAPDVAPSAVPPVRGPVHDLDRAMRAVPAWGRTLAQMVDRNQRGAWRDLGLKPRPVRRLVTQVVEGRRARAVFVSRLRLLWRWVRR